jgi:hypothetical protein
MFVAIAGGFFGLFLSLMIVHELFGNRGVLFGLFLFPFVFVYFPFYTLLAYGSWNLLLLNYGSLAVSWLLLSIAEQTDSPPRSAIDEPPTRPVATQESPAFAVILLLIGGLLVAAIVSTFAQS